MSGALLLALLMALPLTLLVGAFVFISWDQDRRGTFIVQLGQDADLEEVLARHRADFDVTVQQSWAHGSTPGYRATIRHRRINKLCLEPDVESVELTEN